MSISSKSSEVFQYKEIKRNCRSWCFDRNENKMKRVISWSLRWNFWDINEGNVTQWLNTRFDGYIIRRLLEQSRCTKYSERKSGVRKTLSCKLILNCIKRKRWKSFKILFERRVRFTLYKVMKIFWMFLIHGMCLPVVKQMCGKYDSKLIKVDSSFFRLLCW